MKDTTAPVDVPAPAEEPQALPAARGPAPGEEVCLANPGDYDEVTKEGLAGAAAEIFNALPVKKCKGKRRPRAKASTASL